MGLARVFQLLHECVPHPDLGGTYATRGHCDPHASRVDAASGHPVGLGVCK